jgi:hypothetical protein
LPSRSTLNTFWGSGIGKLQSDGKQAYEDKQQKSHPECVTDYQSAGDSPTACGVRSVS